MQPLGGDQKMSREHSTNENRLIFGFSVINSAVNIHKIEFGLHYNKKNRRLVLIEVRFCDYRESFIARRLN